MYKFLLHLLITTSKNNILKCTIREKTFRFIITLYKDLYDLLLDDETISVI